MTQTVTRKQKWKILLFNLHADLHVGFFTYQAGMNVSEDITVRTYIKQKFKENENCRSSDVVKTPKPLTQLRKET